MTIAEFWNAYLATLPADHPARTAPIPNAEAYGDSPQLADELGRLIHIGTKTATCGSLWEYECEKIPVPQAGQLEIVLDGRSEPLAITELTEVVIRPYNEVDADFAWEEGEGDRTLQSWREGHWRFFTRVLQKINRQPDPAMPLVCQRFRVVFRR